MSDAKVLGHVIHEHRPAGSDAKFERGPGRTSFLPDFPCFAENQQKARRMQEEQAPELLMASPMCAAFSALQGLNF